MVKIVFYVYTISQYNFVELFYNRDIILGCVTRSGMSILCVVSLTYMFK